MRKSEKQETEREINTAKTRDSIKRETERQKER